MKSRSRHRPPSWHQQLTAGFAAVLVLTLTVLAASPQLHDWVHGHGATPVRANASAPGHDVSSAEQDDYGCVVAVFANGVILAALGLLTVSALKQGMDLIPRVETVVYRQTPRYWLPPLCGPPLG